MDILILPSYKYSHDILNKTPEKVKESPKPRKKSMRDIFILKHKKKK